MRKFFVLIFALFFYAQAFAIEEYSSPDEVVLQPDTIHIELEKMGIENAPEHTEIQNKETLRKKLEDIYNLEVTDINTNNYLLTDILTKHFDDNKVIESIHPFAGYNGNILFNFNDADSYKTNYDFNAVNAGFDGKFRDGASDYKVLFSISPLSSRNMIRSAFSDVYVGTNKIENHRLQVGYQRPGNGIESKTSAYQLPFANRSQIARNFGTVRKIGARVIGNYDLVEYDIGGYSSDTYMRSFFPGAEFDGWVNIKPLGKTKGKYGILKLGSGIQVGKRDSDYTVNGAYASYEYKKFMANFEWANANGYNGASGHVSNNHASGFYATLGYKVTPKLQILARYDEFDPNKNIKHNNKREYSAGINYFIKGPGLKLILNYVFCQNDSAKDSHRIILGTQILL
ncbi:MAG: OprO/OprP family phosphate-selective porin [bacterium]|nr:OprO/OprP family phosphate-selective porin [bacterium]